MQGNGPLKKVHSLYKFFQNEDTNPKYKKATVQQKLIWCDPENVSSSCNLRPGGQGKQYPRRLKVLLLKEKV